MTNQKLLDSIHIEIHAIRLIDGYKPSKFEQKLNKLIAEEYSNNCKDCKERLDKLKNAKPNEKKSFFGNVGDILKGGVE